MALEQFANFATTTLNGSHNNSTTSIAVASTTGSLFPSTGNFRIIIDQEIMLCTSRSTDTLTVTRAQEGTSAASHAGGSVVSLPVTDGNLRQVTADFQSRGTYANRPAQGQAGRIYFPSDAGGTFWHDDGSTWNLYAAGHGPLTPPVGDFATWVNQNSSAIDETPGYSILYKANPAGGGDSIVQRLKSFPGTPFNMTLCYKFAVHPGAGMYCGIAMRDSSTSRVLTFGINALHSMLCINWSSNTASNATLFDNLHTWSSSHELIMLRLRVTSTQFIFQYSVDFVNWYTHHTRTISGDYMAGANQIGFFLDAQVQNNSAQTAAMVIYHGVAA